MSCTNRNSNAEADSKSFNSDLAELGDHEVRDMLHGLCRELQARGAFFPSEVTYSPQQQRGLLQLPIEIRESIFQWCYPEFMDKLKIASPPVRFYLQHQPEPGVGWPVVMLEFAGPIQIPQLAATCRHTFYELVGTAFARHTYKVRVDCAHLRRDQPLKEFFHLVFERGVIQVLRHLRVEFRCSIAQWDQLSAHVLTVLKEIARLTLGQAIIGVRIFLEFPVLEHNAFITTLPPFYSAEDVRISSRTWLQAYARSVDKKFLPLKSISSVQQIELLHHEQIVKIATSERFRVEECGHITVFARQAEQWRMITGARVHHPQFQYLIRCDDEGRILDL